MAAKIYLICKDGEPKYVGFTKRSLEQRWREHCRMKVDCPLHYAIRKYGKEAFTIELVAEYIDEQMTKNLFEGFWIEHLQTHVDDGGYNLTYGGDGTIGRPCSEQTRRKMSASNKGQVPWNKGKKVSAETLKKMSDAQKGKKSPLKGKPRSEETRRKIGENRKAYNRAKQILEGNI